jgi:flavin-dependent dehydrogenase
MISKVVIVGGGSSGWLAATAFKRYYPEKNVILIESKTVPRIGVGESTTATFRSFVKDMLKIDESEFMVGSEAIYKQAVKFQDFYYLGDGGFYYPFGEAYTEGLTALGLDAWDVVKSFNKDLPVTDFTASVSPIHALYMKNKISDNLNGEFDNYDPNMHRGYHLNAPKLADYLKDRCISLGVTYIQADVLDADMVDEKIASVVLDDGSRVEGDLFVDCTGFRSALINKKMNSKFIDLSYKLPNNRVWATPIQYKNIYSEMTPYTNSTALKNGWAWYTPIWSRIGNGYAYSDKYTNPEDALTEFKSYLLSTKTPLRLSKEEVDDLPFFEVKMRAGFYEEGMIKNVVSVGLSSGFLEPLEGTGLYFIQESITQLMRILNRRDLNQFAIDHYNAYMKNLYLVWADGISLFYASSVRDDSEYWKEIKNKKFDAESVMSNHMYSYHGIQSFIKRALVDTPDLRTFFDLYANVSRGMEMVTRADHAIIDRWQLWDGLNYEELAAHFKSIFDERKAKWELNSRLAPHIYDYLNNRFYFNKDTRAK